MTALTTRDALAKAVRAVYDRHDHRAPLNHVNLVEWVDAVLASGAVIDAAALADDLAKRAAVYESHPEHDTDRYLDGFSSAMRVAEQVVRAAALSEGVTS